MPGTRHRNGHGALGVLSIVLYIVCGAVSAQAMAVEPIALPGLPAVRISEIVETDDHRLWFGGLDGLWVHDGRSLKEVALPSAGDGPRGVRRLCAVGDDLLLAMHSGVGRIAAGSQRVEMLPGLDGVQAYELTALPDGSLWLFSAIGVLSYRDGDSQLEPAPGKTRLAEVVVGSTHLWSWDEECVWARPIVAPRTPWRMVANLSVRDLQADGDGVLAVGARGVVHLTVDRSPQWLVVGGQGHGILRSDGLLWVRREDQLLVGEPGAATLRPVQFFRGSSPAPDLKVQRLFRDSSGLMWVGTQLGVMRINLCPGVDNLLIACLEDGERPGAVLEMHDGRLLIGTNRGRLLESQHGWGTAWQPHAVGWEPQGAITCLLEDPAGRVWVGTRLHGLWCGERGAWQRIGGDQLMRGVRDLLWFDQQLWLCTNRRVMRYDIDRGMAPVPVWSGEQGGGLPCALLADDRGVLWLGTYRRGLFCYDPEQQVFAPVALADDSALSIDVGPDNRQLVAATTHELWTIDTGSHVVQRWPSLGRSAFRDLRFDGHGTLWETRSRQLLQLDKQKVHEVGPGTGAHPLGYAYLAGCRLRNGDLVFGANQGLTRVRTGTTLSTVGRAKLTGFEIIDSETGAITDLRPGVSGLRVSPSFRVTPEVLDRSIDLPLACTVRLEPLEGTGPELVGDGDFTAVPAGLYHASVEVLQVNGCTVELGLGTLDIVPVAESSVPWLVVCTVVLLFGLAWWRMRRMVVAARRPALERVLTEAGHDPDEVLDLAFVVVGAAECCLQASGAQRVSAWVQVGSHEPALLAEFGAGADDTMTCKSRFARRDSEWSSCVCEGHREVSIELVGCGELAFHVVLAGVYGSDDEIRPAVERALQPARAALDRSVWVDRLQDFCVNSSLSIEADLHDLRSSLTVLRLGVAELRRERGGLDPLIGSLGNATEELLQAVKRLQAPRAMQLQLEDPVRIVSSVLESSGAVGAARGIRLLLRATAHEPSVQLDPVWFRRAVENVVGNALKYSDDASTIEVTVLDEGRSVSVRVDDAGPGIDADERSRLFLPGVVGKAQPRNGEAKTGIGLWVSRQAMRAMGGSMWIEPRPGGGTRVVLQLPRSSATGADAPATPRQEVG